MLLLMKDSITGVFVEIFNTFKKSNFSGHTKWVLLNFVLMTSRILLTQFKPILPFYTPWKDHRMFFTCFYWVQKSKVYLEQVKPSWGQSYDSDVTPLQEILLSFWREAMVVLSQTYHPFLNEKFKNIHVPTFVKIMPSFSPL